MALFNRQRRSMRRDARQWLFSYMQQHPEATKEEILEAAEHYGDSEGFDPSTIREWLKILLEFLPFFIKIFAP